MLDGTYLPCFVRCCLIDSREVPVAKVLEFEIVYSRKICLLGRFRICWLAASQLVSREIIFLAVGVTIVYLFTTTAF